MRPRKHPLAVVSLEERTTPAGTITGTVWHDIDGDGVRTAEPGIAGRTVFLDSNKNGRLDTGEKTAITDSTGLYQFTGLGAGTFTIAQLLPDGWQQSAPTAARTVTLDQEWQPGGTTYVFDFQEFASNTTQLTGTYRKNGFKFDTTSGSSTKFRIFGSSDEPWYSGSAAFSSQWAPVTISLVEESGRPFAITSIQLAEYTYDHSRATVDFTGTKVDGTPVTQRFVTDGAGGFETFTFTGFTNLQSLTWKFTGFSDYHEFDNVTVQTGSYVAGDASGQDFGTVELPSPTVSTTDVSEPERTGSSWTLNLPVTLSAPNPYPVTLYYRTESGTATPGGFSGAGDYTHQQGSLTIPAGETTATISIGIIGDSVWENDESFYVRLDSALNAGVATPSATITLLADDVLAMADNYTTVANTPLDIAAPGVLTNDKGLPNAPLTAEIVANPTNGTVALNSDGSFTYTPNSGFVGADSFNYAAISGGYQATAKVTIQVRSSYAPELNLPGTQTFPEDTTLVFSAATGNAISISDPDAGSNPMYMTLYGYGNITLSTLDGIDITSGQNGGSSIGFVGTLSAINAALEGMTYRPPTNAFGNNYVLTASISDQAGGLDRGQVPFFITPVNDPPVNNLSGTSVTTLEDRGVTVPRPTVTDVDNAYGGTNTGVRVTFSVPEGAGTILVGIYSNSGLTVTGNGTRQVVITGTISNFNSGLASITVYPAADLNGAIPLTMATSDKGNYGAGGEQFDIDTITINVTPVNDAPSLTIPNPSVTVVGGTGRKSFPGFATDIVAGPPTATDELATQTVSIERTSLTMTGGLTFVSGPTLGADGTLTFEATPGTYGTATVKVRARDDGGTANGGIDASTERTFTITVTNANPVVTPPANQSADEGATTSFNLGSFTDNGPDQPWSVTVDWGDSSADDQFSLGDLGSLGSRSHAYADDGTYTVTILVADRLGAVSEAKTFDVTVSNVAPTISPVTGPSTAVRGQTRTYTVSATDPGDDTLTFSWRVTNSSGSIVATGSGTSFDFTPTATGTFTVTATVDDGDGGSDSSSTSLAVSAIEVQPDPVNPGEYMLAVGGTTANDSIAVNKASGTNRLAVSMNGSSFGPFFTPGSEPFSRVVVFGQAGSDTIGVNKKVTVPAWLLGGDGNDRLTGGGSWNVLLGGAGNDTLTGGSNRDLIVGGLGADNINGSGSDDIVITGWTSFDSNDAALNAIMAEWTSGRSFDVRQANLTDGSGSSDGLNLNYFLVLGDTVFDDEDSDTLVRSGGDWRFYDPERDRLR